GGTDLSMFEVDEAARIITEAADPEANIIFGAVIDDAYTGQIKCTVIATGFDADPLQTAVPNAALRHIKGFGSHAVAEEPKREREDPRSPAASKPSLHLSEEELEVPAFMRKPVGK
ncbi:cell division protein FtsZ, partial [Candidatus Peribacteria bacterium]|nr:cell division protein FtsZ [Candidatus Peribacteria bacterium]